MDWPLRFGIFLAPFHPVGQNPTLALHDDVAWIEHLDRLGYDEAWIGEHHSAGYEIIAWPEVFIAHVAARTSHPAGNRRQLAPLPPLMLADRMVLLDHLTKGRVMLGCGPGAPPSDAFMMGIDVARQRDMMEEGLEAILRLLDGDGHDGDRLVHPARRPPAAAALQPAPHGGGRRRADLAGGPAGGRTLRLLAALHRRDHPGRFDLLGAHWDVMEERSAQFGSAIDRRDWRLVAPVHVAETKEHAYADVQFGLAEWVDYQAGGRPPRAGDRRLPRAGRRHERVGLRRHRHA